MSTVTCTESVLDVFEEYVNAPLAPLIAPAVEFGTGLEKIAPVILGNDSLP